MNGDTHAKAAAAGRRALVTGSFQGIGLAIAEALAAEQCHSRLARHCFPRTTSIRKATRDGRWRAFGNMHVAGSVGSDADRSVNDGVLTAGPLDILVNNAGIQQTAPLTEMPNEVWDRIIAINLTAAFLTMKAALPGMAERGYGRVVNIASVHGLVALNQQGALRRRLVRAGRTVEGCGARICQRWQPAAGGRDGESHLPRLDRNQHSGTADHGARRRFRRRPRSGCT